MIVGDLYFPLVLKPILWKKSFIFSIDKHLMFVTLLDTNMYMYTGVCLVYTIFTIRTRNQIHVIFTFYM